MRCERGQATIEWVGLVLLACVVLGALATTVPLIDGRPLGALIAHRIVCATKGHCDDGDSELRAAYGDSDAALVRRYAPSMVFEPGEPSMPVDYRKCRRLKCAAAPDGEDLDSHRTRTGQPATVFTHVVHRDGRTYLQYFFYYPDSNTVLGAPDRFWNKAARGLGRRINRGPIKDPYHLDDWEGYQVRIAGDGSAAVRATQHGGYTWCKYSRCNGMWGPDTDWTRVSRGSHAGHVPVSHALPRNAAYQVHKPSRWRLPVDPRPSSAAYNAKYPGHGLEHERSTTSEGLRLVPLERVDQSAYRPLAPEIKPPWLKSVYDDPESPDS